MEKIVIERNKKLINEPILLLSAYEVYAMNNSLPVFNEETKADGDYYVYVVNGQKEVRPASFSFDEMIAKIINTLFKDKMIYVSSKMIDSHIAEKDSRGLGLYLASELEHDIKIEVAELKNDAMNTLILRFGKGNALNMGVGTVVFDEKNELHVAFGRVRKAMYDIAEGLCQ